ncbi:MAG: polysaccharide pyruvyl transferase family protein [Bacteroidota bacterium]
MKLYIYWWEKPNSDGYGNYGDILAPYLANKLSKKEIVKVEHPMKWKYRFFFKHPLYVTVGSIIKEASKKSIVWGSGIIKKNEKVKNATFLAVRGPRTRARLIELGYKVPEVYGDPALLLPNFIKNDVEKKYELGIIPHYVDYEEIVKIFSGDSRVKIINLMTDDVEKTTREILECKKTVSSSLHGVIISQSYSIPSLWVKFSNKLAGDNIKFFDYFESVGINSAKEIIVPTQEMNYERFMELFETDGEQSMPNMELMELRKNQLLSSCPFKE